MTVVTWNLERISLREQKRGKVEEGGKVHGAERLGGGAGYGAFWEWGGGDMDERRQASDGTGIWQEGGGFIERGSRQRFTRG